MKRLSIIANQLKDQNSNSQSQANENFEEMTLEDKIPEEHLQQYEDLKSILKLTQKYQELSQQNNWKYVGTKQGISAYYKQDKGSQNLIFRGEAILNDNIDDLSKMVFNLQDKSQYVEAVKQYDCLKIINESMYIAYIRLKSPIGIQDRDLVTITGVFRGKDDTIAIVQQSIDYQQKKPQKGIIRANLKFQTWFLKKQQQNTTKIILVGCFDPQGVIPNFIKNQVVKDQGYSIQYIKEYLQNNKKNIKKQN